MAWATRAVGGGLIAALLLGWAAAGAAAEAATQINASDTPEQVIAKLGKPQGRFTQGRHTIYYYDRGMVDFEDGHVTRADLVTPEEAAQLKQERDRAFAERLRQEAAERQRLTDEGQAELQRRLGDPQFTNRPPAERLAYWQGFRQRYPYTDVGDRIAAAEADVAATRRADEQQTEVAMLAARIEEIRARFKQLDADYAASLANWKRNEIDAERAKLKQELEDDLSRLGVQPEPVQTNATPAARPAYGM